MNHMSLFSGIGGFDLAAEWAGFNNVMQCEIEPYCLKVLEKNFPNVPKHNDIRTLTREAYDGAVDIISGGFPCQPFSIAGKMQGKHDRRHLWPEMFRVIKEFKPTWVVGENVANFTSMGLDEVCDELENEGYEVQAFSIPAAGLGAWHRRERIWIVANTSCLSKRADTESQEASQRGNRPTDICETVSNPHGERLEKQQSSQKPSMPAFNSRAIIEGRDYWATEPAVGRVANGIPNRLDRIRGLGNAIVPQVACEIFKAILTIY